MSARLDELGMEGLEERLRSATESPSQDPYRLARLIAEIIPSYRRPVLAFEVSRSAAGTETSQALAELSSRLALGGADALVVPTDTDDTPEGLSDLFAVCRASGAVATYDKPAPPVFCRDWFLHPLQVVDAKEAGCAGIIGVIASVTGSRGTPVLSSFAAALGLDAPVEIVNLLEMKAMEASGVPFYALNISVGLSVSISGFGSDVAAGLLGELPFGAVTLVGVKSVDEARAARAAGADALFVRRELVGEYRGREKELVEALISATNGDD